MKISFKWHNKSLQEVKSLVENNWRTMRETTLNMACNNTQRGRRGIGEWERIKAEEFNVLLL